MIKSGYSSMHEADELDIFKGKKYWVSGSVSNYPGEISKMAKDVVTDDPKVAIESWFKINKKFPMDSDISTKTKKNAMELWKYANEHEEWIRELCKKYNCHMKPDYMVNEIKRKVEMDYFHETKYGDQIHPFDRG